VRATPAIRRAKSARVSRIRLPPASAAAVEPVSEPGQERPEADAERELAAREAAWRRRRGEREHRCERAADRDDQERRPAEHGEMEVDEHPAIVDDAGERLVPVREDERSERQRGSDVETDERNPGAAGNEGSSAGRPADEAEQLGQHDQHTG